MKAEYDFSQARRGAVAIEPGKTRVTIRLDNDVLDWYRKQVQEHGGNYQTAINAALREQMTAQDGALERVLRRVISKEIENLRLSFWARIDVGDTLEAVDDIKIENKKIITSGKKYEVAHILLGRTFIIYDDANHHFLVDNTDENYFLKFKPAS